MYADWIKMMSYNFYITIVIGTRGCGKSFGCTKLIEQARLKGKGKWVWMRDTQTGLDKFAGDLAMTLQEIQMRYGIYNDDDGNGPTKFVVKYDKKQHKVYLNGEHIGYTFLLSTAPQQKGSKFGTVIRPQDLIDMDEEVLEQMQADSIAYVVYDEFIDETIGRNLVLRDKVELFESARESIARKGTTKFILMANKFSAGCELLRGWGFKSTEKGTVNRSPAMVRDREGNIRYDDNGKPMTLRKIIGLFDLNTTEYEDSFDNNPAAMVSSVTDYGRYVLTNKMGNKDYLMIDGMPAGATPFHNIVDDVKIGLYWHNDNIIATGKLNGNVNKCFNLDKVTPECRMMFNVEKSMFRQFVSEHKIYFTDEQLRDWMIGFIGM